MSTAWTIRTPLALLALAPALTWGCGGADEAVELPSDANSAPESDDASGNPTVKDTGQLQSALSQAKHQWEQAGTPSYVLKVRRLCFCGPASENDVQVEVHDNRVVAAVGAGANGQYDVEIEASRLQDWYTVHGLFERVEKGLDTADRLDVVFDETLGFPAQLVFDYTLESAEEGEYFEVWDFSPTP